MKVRLSVAALALAGLALSPSSASADYQPPPIRHVWVIVLENASYNTIGTNSPFNTPGYSPYLADTLTKQGNLLTQYWGIGHNSLDNYIAMVSGQSPTPDTQGDCLSGTDIVSLGTDPHGQTIAAGSEGCVYPAGVKTLADQLEANGFTWKGYMQDLRDSTGRNGSGCPTLSSSDPAGGDQYVRKHDPFQWFHSIIDDQSRCLSHDVPLTELAPDLQGVRTTPNFSFITPGMVDDGHDGDWTLTPDQWLRQYVPMIMSSPAYRQDGMILITFDESGTFTGVPFSGAEDDQACCNEIPGPNSPMPGILGPGGGRTGALVLSPFVKPGTKDDPPDNPLHAGPAFYNQYSFLRSMEDLFAIDSGGDDGHGHLGFAGSYGPEYPGPGAFGPDVYNGWDGSPANPAAPEPAHGPTGPRAADGTATWQNPLPQGGDLNGVSCASGSACVAVGDAGAIVASSDGDRFTPEMSGTAADLNAVGCATASDCVAVGDRGTVLASADGGATWSSRSSGTTTALNGVSCPTASICVAVGDDGAILRSGDGGNSWAAQDSGTREPLYGVSCASESACFAAGGGSTVLTTTDGSTWSAKTLPTSFGPELLRAISCPSASACFVTGANGVLFRTTDGGTTWSAQATQGNGNGRADYFWGVSCPSPGACFVAGEEPRGNTSAGNDPAAIQATTNGDTSNPFSVNWTRQPTHSTNILHAVSCSGTTTCVAVGMRGSILRTTDGGAGWSARSPGTDGELSRIVCTSNAQCLPEGMNALEGASCPTARDCFAVGSDRTVMASSDGGATWSTQTSGVPKDGGFATPPVAPPGLNAVDCPSSSACVGVGDLGSVVTTANGGANWSNHDSGTKSDLLGVSCPGKGSCFAVGSRGTILHTSDGGQSWAEQSSGTANLLVAVSCAKTTTCVAVGSFGAVLSTRNAGKSWSLEGAATSAYLDGVDCPSAKVCVAVGSGGTVLRSANGGASWSPQDSGVGDDLMSVNCATSSSCLASGSLGALVSTVDGGGSWSVRGTGTSRALRAVSCPRGAGCIAAGDGAAILRVTP